MTLRGSACAASHCRNSTIAGVAEDRHEARESVADFISQARRVDGERAHDGGPQFGSPSTRADRNGLDGGRSAVFYMTRRDGRVVDGGGLENHCTRKVLGVRILSSKPSSRSIPPSSDGVRVPGDLNAVCHALRPHRRTKVTPDGDVPRGV